MEAAIAAAPGAPHEVRAGDDDLDQVCGCSMVLDKTKLPEPAPFDELFTTAGDDVDFSWSLRERGFKLAYASGATVIHRRRATIDAYLRQQIGYGRGEAVLARKYPNRAGPGRGVYGGAGWIERWFNVGARVYYGAFGRGLFQSLYRGPDFPFALQIPLGVVWLVLSVLLILIGMFSSKPLVAAGTLGLITTLASAITMAATVPLNRDRSTSMVRQRLALLNLLGSIVRDYARLSVRWRPLFLDLKDPRFRAEARIERNGRVALAASAPNEEDHAVVDRLIQSMRRGLLKRNVTVFLSDGYQPYDLELETGSGVTAAINILLSRDNPPTAGWKLAIRFGALVTRAAWMVGAVMVAAVASDFRHGLMVGSIVAGVIAVKAASLYILDARLIPPLIEIVAREAGAEVARTPSDREAAA